MNKVMVAVAGAGKTNRLAADVVSKRHSDKVAVLTYTKTNQNEDSIRISSQAGLGQKCAIVLGWKSFLLNEIVRPYLMLLYPDIKLRGLSLNDPDDFRDLKGSSRYISNCGDVYPSLLGKLAVDVIARSNNAAIDRLEDLYEDIYIDEGQDIQGNDLRVLEELFKSKINLHVYLDPRQSLLSTAPRDTKFKKYRCVNVIKLYQEWERRNLCSLYYLNETKRCIPQIAAFSDVIFADYFCFSPTCSMVPSVGSHCGIFIIGKDEILSYAKLHSAVLLASQESGKYGVDRALNFGKAKGLTVDHVIIVASAKIEDFLKHGKRLPPESACGFYVAVTRARYSVAIAVTNPRAVLKAVEDSDSIWKGLNIQRG